MKEFSKKTSLIFMIISIIGLVLSFLLILFANELITIVHSILETKVFNREIDFDKWFDTLAALFTFPVFIVIAVDSIFFIKFPKKEKIILASVVFLLVAVLTVYCSQTRCNQYVDSDLASELLLAKECVLEHSFVPTGWHYSTEIRLLNNQLITAPLFAFISNWFTVKTLTVFLWCVVLSLSLLFLLNQLNVKSLLVKLVSCLLIFCPWSTEMWRIVQFGNYYIPHIAISFVYIGLFIAIAYSGIAGNKNRVFTIIYFALAFISGLSGIRYILYFQFPLMAVAVSIGVNELFRSHDEFNWRNFFIKNKPVYFSCIGFLLGGIGYVFNTLVLSRIFSFSQFNTTTFNALGDISFTDVHRAIFYILGYKDNVSVLTPSGAVNILIYVAIVFLVICMANMLKLKTDKSRFVFLLFAIVMAGFNAFTYINTEYIARYFILILVYIIPCLAVIISENQISSIKRYILGVSWSILLLSGSFVTFETVLCSDKNQDKHAVLRFLEEKEYTFGYGTFWNANVFTFMSNGKIEIANLEKTKDNGQTLLTDQYEYSNWLTPKRYYNDNYKSNQKVFLIVDSDEYAANFERNIFKAGRLVYSDDDYYVYEYQNRIAFERGY